jgi:hypothetical protein
VFGTVEIVALFVGMVLPWVVVMIRLVTFAGVTLMVAVPLTP